jgi:ATP-dependent helicase HrpB
VDLLAPAHLTVPGGSRLPVDYSQDPPVLAVRIQEMFGAAATPAVADGRLPVVLHLLSPAGRPLQVTRDLAHFWRSAYHTVKKEMRGRYPRHPWPDDPLQAPATRRAKPRKAG